MGTFRDLKDQVFGRLTAIEPIRREGSKRVMWLCECQCGKETEVRGSHLTGGKIKSCGCLLAEDVKTRSITHGMTKNKTRPPEYGVWSSMKNRCFNENDGHYHLYGGRGIEVCERWANSFEAFYQDMGPRPSDEHSIDRYPDNDGNYEPGNVRWATPDEQASNRRVTSFLVFDGKSRPLSLLAKQHGMSSSALHTRIKKGWTVDEALKTPIGAKRPGNGTEESPGYRPPK